MRSFPDLSGFAFSDHTPWLLFTAGVSGVLPRRRPGPRSFNVLPVREETERGCELLSSFYDMRGGDLNLLLASTLDRSHPWLRRWPSPPGAGLLTPVQVWTPDTCGDVEAAASTSGLTFAAGAPVSTTVAV